MGACAGAASPPAGQPAADPAALEAELRRGTPPGQSRQVSFTWTLNEAGARVNGRGVVRSVTPERLRLDLFGPRNETFLAAALVGDAYRLPSGVAERVTLPSPALLWGGLGVVRPPTGSVLSGASAADSSAVLSYRVQTGDVYQFSFGGAGASRRLESVERLTGGSRLESVRLTRSATGAVERAQYRNWSAYRELTLEIQEMKDVAGFAESVWQP